jgi:hypothetical protein
VSEKAIGPPTPLARQFVRLVVGFTVGVGVGLAPFLGTVDVPLFQQLADVFPNQGRDRLFALGAFLMGVVAVAIQFYAGERVSGRRVRRLFSRTLVAILVALAILTVLVVMWVERVDTAGGVASFVLAGEREAHCPCAPEEPKSACLGRLGADPAQIARCWSEETAKWVHLALLASYLLLTGGFGALIGLLLLQRAAKQQAAGRARKRRKAKREPPPVPGTDDGAG